MDSHVRKTERASRDDYSALVAFLRGQQRIGVLTCQGSDSQSSLTPEHIARAILAADFTGVPHTVGWGWAGAGVPVGREQVVRTGPASNTDNVLEAWGFYPLTVLPRNYHQARLSPGTHYSPLC